MITPIPPDVNAIPDLLLSGAREVLGHRFLGLYLYGSLATGHFDPETSDLDVLVVTTEELPGDVVAALAEMHARLAATANRWAANYECDCLPLAALRRYEWATAQHPHLGVGERLRVEQHGADWVIHRWELRAHGVTVAGPLIETLIDPVSPEQLREAVRDLLHGWWAPMVDDPTRLRDLPYQAYAMLTMCRILYTLEHGHVVPKPVAAQWALQTLPPRWQPLIHRALAHNLRPDDLSETQELVRYAVVQSQA